MKVLLDTNFIMTCVKQKIDFFEKISLMGIEILIPEEVVRELERKDAKTSLQILKKEKSNFKEIKIGKGNVDKKIILFSKKNPEVIIASLDKEIKEKTKWKKMVIRNKKKLEII